MTSSTSALLRGTSAACLMLAAVPAMAQESQSDTNSMTIEEIVVTAQFRKQNLQDTPLAITAISGDTLAARGQFNVQEIAAQAPNVTLTPNGAYAGNSLVAFIRGVGQTDFNPALEPGVGLYVDNVYYSTLTGSVLELIDIDRIEVLRGPQGTLSGKNSIGGAIKLFTKRPDDDTDGYVEVSYGSYDAVKVRGASNFTLSEGKLWARISGVSSSRNGYVTTYDYGCTHPDSAFASATVGGDCKTGTDGGVSYTAARLALRWQASDTLEINIAGDYIDDNSESTANTMLAVGPTTAPIFHPNGTVWENLAIPGMADLQTGCQFIAYGAASCDPLSPNDPYASYADYTDARTGLTIPRKRTLEAHSFTMNVDWQLSADLQLESITGYRKYNSSFSGDYDASPMPTALLFQTVGQKQWSQEVRLNGNFGDRVDWTVGGFYHDSKATLEGRIDLGYVGFDFIHGPDPVDARTWALFANSIIHLADGFDLTAGLRYSDDKKVYDYARHNPDGSDIQPCTGPLGDPTNPANCLISSLNGVTSTFEDTRVDYRVALSYEFTDDFMAYASLSTGYKGGGVNPRPFYNVQAVSFNPEEMTTYELGAKWDLLGKRLRLNGAVFYNDYTDIQLTFNNCTELFGATYGTPCLLNSNAGNAKVKGAELEFDFLATDSLSFDGSLSVLDFSFKEVNSATGISEDAIPPFTPELTWSLGAQYQLRTDFGTITPRVDISYQDDVFTAPDNTELGKIDGYTLVNAFIRFTSKDESWVLGLEGRNLTDKLYYTMKTDSTAGNAGVVYGTPALPRTFMVTLKRNL